MSDPGRTNSKVIFALFLVHFSGDLYSSFVRPLMPLLADKLQLSLADIGWITGIFSLLAFVVQPTVGYLADRFQTRFFILGGVLLSAVFIPLIGIVPSVFLLVVCIALGSIGSSMYHPHAAGMVPVYAGRHTGFAMACFWIGGAGAFGVGPVVCTWWVDANGLEALPWLALFGVACFAVISFILPMPQNEGLRSKGFWGSIKEIFHGVWQPLIFIWLIIMFRSFVQQSLMTYIPMLADSWGYSLVSIGVLISTYTITGSLIGLGSGWLADRIGFKTVIRISLALATPCILAFLYLPGAWVYLGAILAGAMLLASMPLTVALAQEIAPKGRSMIASLMMGFAFGLGGMLVPISGMAAEAWGIRPVLSAVGVVPLLLSFLVFKLPGKQKTAE